MDLLIREGEARGGQKKESCNIGDENKRNEKGKGWEKRKKVKKIGVGKRRKKTERGGTPQILTWIDAFANADPTP